jgi:hypothetical protein
VTGITGLREEERAAVLLRVYLEFKHELEDKGVVLGDVKTVLTRFRGLFEFTGALLLGLLTGCFTIMLNFLIVVMLLHLDVSRYSGFLFPG